MNFEILSILASIFELSGIYLLSIKNRIGFLLNMLAGVLWVTYVLTTHNAIGLIFVCSVAFIINCRGFRNWNKSKEKTYGNE